MDIRGKNVLVSGGAGSLGSAIAADLLERGANVSVIDAHDPATAQERVRYFRADLADDDATAAALEKIVEGGVLHALVNCAGLIHSEPLVNLTNPSARRHRLDTWEATIRSNLTATFVLSARVAELMAANRTKGVIINISSISATGNPGQTAYAAAKAGVEAMTRVWSRELGPLGIRAVAIAPGFIATPSTQAALSDEALADLKRKTPLLRLGKAIEIAQAVAFAIENDFVTGTTIAVGGGLVL